MHYTELILGFLIICALVLLFVGAALATGMAQILSFCGLLLLIAIGYTVYVCKFND